MALEDPIENGLFSPPDQRTGPKAGSTVLPWLAPIGQGALSPDKQTKLDDIRDGTSSTIMLAEIAGRPSLYQKNLKRPDVMPLGSNFFGQTAMSGGGGWGDSTTGAFILLGSDANGDYLQPLPLPSGNNSCLINCSNNLGLYSFHTGGAQVVFCDGSVHFIVKEVTPQTMIALITRGGAEVIQEDF
jgi:prepilin-type processing-associated H-X9-DG protein